MMVLVKCAAEWLFRELLAHTSCEQSPKSPGLIPTAEPLAPRDAFLPPSALRFPSASHAASLTVRSSDQKL